MNHGVRYPVSHSMFCAKSKSREGCVKKLDWLQFNGLFGKSYLIEIELSAIELFQLNPFTKKTVCYA